MCMSTAIYDFGGFAVAFCSDTTSDYQCCGRHMACLRSCATSWLTTATEARQPAARDFESFGHCLTHADCFNEALSIGILRRRLPVAAKMALAIAGTIADVPVSPIPPGGSELLTMWTSMTGASFMRSIW